MTKVCGIYAVLMGAGLIGTWIVLFATGKAVDPTQSALQTWSLLTAEFLTGALLLLGGWGVLTHRNRGIPVHLVSLGMLLYVSIFSVGVFDEAGNLPATIFFVLVALCTGTVVAVRVALSGRELTGYLGRSGGR